MRYNVRWRILLNSLILASKLAQISKEEPLSSMHLTHPLVGCSCRHCDCYKTEVIGSTRKVLITEVVSGGQFEVQEAIQVFRDLGRMGMGAFNVRSRPMFVLFDRAERY